MGRAPPPSGRHHHARRAQHGLVQPVALLDDVEDAPRLTVLPRRESLVPLRVELLADGVERLDALALERRDELCVHHPHAVGKVLLVVTGGGDRALEVVEHGEQLADQVGLRALTRLRGLAGRALAVVLELGTRALRELEVLVALALGLGEGLLLGSLLALDLLDLFGLVGLLDVVRHYLSPSTTSASTTSSSP